MDELIDRLEAEQRVDRLLLAAEQKRAPMRFGKREAMDLPTAAALVLDHQEKRAPMRFGKRAPMRFGKRRSSDQKEEEEGFEGDLRLMLTNNPATAIDQGNKLDPPNTFDVFAPITFDTNNNFIRHCKGKSNLDILIKKKHFYNIIHQANLFFLL